MRYQELYFWITVFFVVQHTHLVISELPYSGEQSQGSTGSNVASSYYTEEIYRLNENEAHSKLVSSGNYTNIEVNFSNVASNETVSTSSIFLPDENTTEVPVSRSDFHSVITTRVELPHTKEPGDETTRSNTTEANMTSMISDPMTTTVLLEITEEPEDCIPDNCTTPHHCVFMKSEGCIRLKEGVTENTFSYTIIVPSETSLIYVEIGKEEEDLLPNSTITILFQECGKEKGRWKLESGKQIGKRKYVSKGPTLTLHISTDGNWINATLHYWELEFVSLEENVSESLDAGVLVPPAFRGLRCRPNTRRTYFLKASKSKWNESSVMMTLSFVDLDEQAGDYLLIGAGKKSFGGPHPFFFTGQVSKSRDYYIASDDVYVVYASGASQKTDKKGFHIKWQRSGTAITKPDEKPEEEAITDSVIQSVGICFYNKSFIQEFNTTEDYKGPLQSFLERLASVANIYAKEKNMLLESVLTASSIEIFRVSSVIEPREDIMPAGGVYALVTIVQHFDRKTAVFRRRELEEIIDQLDKKDEETGYSLLGFKVGHCPSVESYFQWYLAAVLLVIISSIVLAIVWICSSLSKWRGFPRDEKLLHGGMNIGYKEPSSPVKENEYIKYIPGLMSKPRLKLTTCDGDAITLDSDSQGRSRSEIDDESDRVIFDQNWLLKKPPSRKELPMSLRANGDNEPSRPFLQTFAAPIPTTRKKGSGRLFMDIPMESLLPQENHQPLDHEYDSLVFPSIVSQRKDGETVF